MYMFLNSTNYQTFTLIDLQLELRILRQLPQSVVNVEPLLRKPDSRISVSGVMNSGAKQQHTHMHTQPPSSDLNILLSDTNDCMVIRRLDFYPSRFITR